MILCYLLFCKLDLKCGTRITCVGMPDIDIFFSIIARHPDKFVLRSVWKGIKRTIEFITKMTEL